MVERVLRSVLFAATFASSVSVLVSCGGSSPHLAVLQGNYAFGRGDYQTATVHYLTANAREDHEPWIDYNLGNVYYALGELDAALEQWEVAAADAPDEILFGVHFNRGVLYYELAHYESAYREFRDALEIDGSSVEAKINLELSLQKSGGVEGGPSARGTISGSESEEVGAQAARVLQYIRRKERQRWSGDDDTIEQPSSNDW